MDQPTEDRIKRLEEEQRQLKEEQEEIKRRLEQRTEEIKTVKVEVASEDVAKRLDNLTQELHTVSNTWLDTLQEHYTEHKKDISDVQTILRGHSKYFEEHGKRLAATATKDDLTKFETTQAEHSQRLDALSTDVNDLKISQAKQNQKLDQILALLQQRPGGNEH